MGIGLSDIASKIDIVHRNINKGDPGNIQDEILRKPKKYVENHRARKIDRKPKKPKVKVTKKEEDTFNPWLWSAGLLTPWTAMGSFVEGMDKLGGGTKDTTTSYEGTPDAITPLLPNNGGNGAFNIPGLPGLSDIKQEHIIWGAAAIGGFILLNSYIKSK